MGYRRGQGISAEGYAASVERINRESDAELADLQAGPTYKMLRENFEANRGGLRPVERMVDGQRMTIYPRNPTTGRMMNEAEWGEYEKQMNANRPQTMEDFYGTASIVSEGAPSPKRGVQSEANVIGQDNQFSLLERERRSWYYV